MNIHKFFLIFFMFIFFTAKPSYPIENRIIYKVNEEIVTHLDIINESKYLILLNPKITELKSDEIYKISKNSLLREQIKKIEISNNKIKLEDGEINKQIENIYQSLGLESSNEFEIYLNNNNYNLEEIKKKISIEFLWNKIIYYKFIDKVKIDIDKIEKQLLELKENNESLLLHEILLNPDENIEESFKLINKSIADNGFENTAAIYSISNTSKVGGKIGWIKKLTINNILRESVLKLDVGDFTKPIRVQSGFLIVFLKDKKLSVDDFNPELERKKLIDVQINEQLNQFSNIYFNKIKKNLTINEL